MAPSKSASVTAPSPDSPPSSPPPDDSNNPPPSGEESPPPASPPPSPPPPSSPPPSSPPPSSPPPSSPPAKQSPPPAKQSPPSNGDSGDDDSPSSGSSSSSGSFNPPPTRSSPPPPSQKALAPPPPRSSSDSTSSAVMEKLPLIVGASIGVGLLIFIMLICLCCRSRKKRKQEDMHYYAPPKTGDYYHNSSQQASWHQPQMATTHVVQLPPPPGNNNGWPAPPPPPPGMMSSGEVSSQFSGPHHPPLPPPSPHVALGFNQSSFTYDDLAAATGGFAQANLVGQGGFGYVHKGILPNGKEIAVKSLKSGSGQGEREFQAEVEIISRVHHRHLVSLVGYCIAGGQRMLVYEFVPNKTLEYHLHGNDQPVMDFPTRLRIALGSAKGLAYLHEDCHPRIIHRDIKAANILLDFNFEAMVADFGLAKLSSDNYTHVSTRVMGTFGYLAPEYAASGKLTEKSDVFSYGVMLLELVTGRRPCDNSNEDSLVDWARPMLQNAIEEDDYEGLVDPRLENNFNPQEMARLVACAAASIRHSARRRPKMSQIARALEGDVSLEDLNEGAKPGQSSTFSSSSDYDTAAYNSDMKKFKKMALSSQEFTSGEFAGDALSSSSGEMRNSRKPPRAY